MQAFIAYFDSTVVRYLKIEISTENNLLPACTFLKVWVLYL